MTVVQLVAALVVVVILLFGAWAYWRRRRRPLPANAECSPSPVADAVASPQQPAPVRLVETDASRYKPGQVWSLQVPGSPQALLKILRVETLGSIETIVHVAVTNVPTTVGHLPFQEAAIDRSVVELVGTDPMRPESLDGYQEWRNAFETKGAGVFSRTVPEVLESMFG
jgi:hypothetical protein